MSGRVYKVAFEHVSAIRHPQYYRGDRPAVAADVVPDEHWTYVERIGDGCAEQYEGLVDLMRRGELIRDVVLCDADVPEPQWREVRR